ncbi:MbeD/MobD family mobilization/exclusion protein [Paenibacillus sp.]|uniref:MbeD/MobD family mobilization/exclusion protein n=1 Tax=Paenibacillus sp. TaxID=58172 RepID=UPI002D6AC745|nr:MbeD/MobD family mobilization/exclusion protein [Paenibacillus sp.]HZG85801.1 MbeD/MobD family mobilization/exclusion protein [Paenibacillus sp.]
MFHTVQPGETLYSIAARYGVTVDALMQANNLTSGYLYAGQTLRIPVTGGGGAGFPFPLPIPVPPGGRRLEERVERLERQHAALEPVVDRLSRQVNQLDTEVDRLRQRVRRLEQQAGIRDE